jgi:putative ABC transport system ATP-binding protein
MSGEDDITIVVDKEDEQGLLSGKHKKSAGKEVRRKKAKMFKEDSNIYFGVSGIDARLPERRSKKVKQSKPTIRIESNDDNDDDDGDDDGDANQETIVDQNDDELDLDDDLDDDLDEQESLEGDAIVSLDNLHKTYLLGVEGVPALRGVSLDVRRGEFLCIFGTSGGGKTSMLNIIGTIDKPTKGSLHICGERIAPNTPDSVTAGLRLRNIGFVFQTFNLLSSLSARENVEMPMILAGELSGAERRQRAVELLTRVGMGDRLDHLPAQLSGGEQQRVTIARALANEPDLLLLDEPTGDLDTVNSAIVMDLLLDLNKRDGITLIMVTHDVGLKWFSDRVIWMRDGKIKAVELVSDDKRDQVTEQLCDDLKSMNHVSSMAAHHRRSSSGNIIDDDDDSGNDSDLGPVPIQVVDSSPSSFPGFHSTVVRRPTDYATHIDYNPSATHASMSGFAPESSTSSSTPTTATPSSSTARRRHPRDQHRDASSALGRDDIDENLSTL